MLKEVIALFRRNMESIIGAVPDTAVLTENIERAMPSGPLVTAAELRYCNFDIPDTIPDHATVPRSEMLIELADVSLTDDGIVNVQLAVTFSEPFRWLA